MTTQPSLGSSGQVNASSAWDGRPTTISQDQSKQLSATPNGTLVFVYQNTNTTIGGILLLYDGARFRMLAAPAGTIPQISIHNWGGNSLEVTNISQPLVPFTIAAAGPGMPGWSCTPLPDDGTNVSLLVGQCAQGTALARYMQLNLRAPFGNLTIFATVGGPTDSGDNNAHVIAVNAAQDTGPNMDPPPDGYYATTTNNYYTYEFNWGNTTVFVANLSLQASSGTVSLAPL